MGTIRDLDDVLSWLETTFYYVRARSKPDSYDFEGLRGRVRDTLDELVTAGFVEMGDDLSIEATARGRLASKYYLRLDTARRFASLCEYDRITVDDVLETVAGADEFDSVSARQSEEDAVNSVLTGVDTALEGGNRKVLAILEASMSNATPAELRSDAWVIRQNALRLLSALREFLERFAGPRAANLARRVEARVENGVSRDAVALTAIDGVGSGRASKLATGGIRTPAEVVEAGTDELRRAGIAEGVAERVVESAREFPAVEVDWGDVPARIGRGENQMATVTVRNRAGGARAGVRVTVNDVEMTARETYLSDSLDLPVGVFGADDDELTYRVEVTFPDLPLRPVVEARPVVVE